MSRPSRVLIAKCGLDGHERGARIVAQVLKEAGMEVIFLAHSARGQTPEGIVTAAEQEGVDVIGLSILSPIYMEVARDTLELLRQKEMEDVGVVIGGVIPQQDVPKLLDMGVKAVFRQNTPLGEIVSYFQGLTSS